jgi:DNA-binding LytR/AlgR family response regulator
MKQPTAAIAEDEPHLRDELKEALLALWPELEIVGEASNGIEALRLLNDKSPDILFLDIQMPGLTGMEVAAQASGRCHVLFVTAYDQHALAAFEQGAIDYVMKPFTVARLATAVSRLKERVNAVPANLSGLLKSLATQGTENRAWLRWINASEGANVRLITVDEVLYFQADNKYTLVITADQEAVIRKPIKELLSQLDPDIFWQIHRSTVVNVNEIRALRKTLAGTLEVRLKKRSDVLTVSAPYVHLFKQM